MSDERLRSAIQKLALLYTQSRGKPPWAALDQAGTFLHQAFKTVPGIVAPDMEVDSDGIILKWMCVTPKYLNYFFINVARDGSMSMRMEYEYPPTRWEEP
jgi:hypothetical protein